MPSPPPSPPCLLPLPGLNQPETWGVEEGVETTLSLPFTLYLEDHSGVPIPGGEFPAEFRLLHGSANTTSPL